MTVRADVDVRPGRHLRAVLVGVPAAAITVHALPALARPAARRGGLLAGRGRPGGVALTFDDGPDADGTPAVLEALEALNWRATFFMLGSQVEAYPEIPRRVHRAGHEIGVHGWSHRNHLLLSPRAAHRDLARACASLTRAVPAVVLRWFRPPYGVLTASSVLAARRLGLRPILWSAWGQDWLQSDADTVAQTVLSSARSRGTVLLHDSDCTSLAGSWRATVHALPLIADELARRGLEVRTLGQHLDRAAAC